jgi:hypothetical protein
MAGHQHSVIAPRRAFFVGLAARWAQRRQSPRRRHLPEVRSLRKPNTEDNMTLKKAVFMILICAAFAYVVFWYWYGIHAAMMEH